MSAQLRTERGAYFVSASGFDTHSDNGETMKLKLGEINAGLRAFINEMKSQGRLPLPASVCHCPTLLTPPANARPLRPLSLPRARRQGSPPPIAARCGHAFSQVGRQTVFSAECYLVTTLCPGGTT